MPSFFLVKKAVFKGCLHGQENVLEREAACVSDSEYEKQNSGPDSLELLLMKLSKPNPPLSDEFCVRAIRPSPS